MLRDEQNELYSLDSNQSVEFEYLSKFSSYPAPKIYEELMESHQLAKDFISELGDLKDTPLLDTLVNYCKDMKLGLKTSEQILDLMEGRLTK